MKKNKLAFLIITLFLFSCNADRQELIIDDLKNNGIDTSNLSNNTSNNDDNNNTSSDDALGSQKIFLSVVVDASFASPVTTIRARAFTSRSPTIVSTWVELTGLSGTFTGTYDFAPNPSQPFGIQIQAFNGTIKVADKAGEEDEYPNTTTDGSTITGATITLDSTTPEPQ